MTIYTSEKVVPYVYMGIHRVTGEFYIGSRGNKATQKLPSHQDIYKYRTSSKRVKPIFDEFDWVIVAEFFGYNDAFAYEQDLISHHKHDPLLLNGACFVNSLEVCNPHKPCTDARRNSIAKARLSTPKITCTHCNKSVDPGNYKKSHGDMCKHNPNIDPSILSCRSQSNKERVARMMQLGTFNSVKPKHDVLLTCPHCGKSSTNNGTMHLHHMDRCPQNPTGNNTAKHPTKSRVSCLCCHKEYDLGNYTKHITRTGA